MLNQYVLNMIWLQKLKNKEFNKYLITQSKYFKIKIKICHKLKLWNR
jgi:hypothetical protein